MSLKEFLIEYFVEFFYELKYQFAILFSGTDLFNWKWFLTALVFAVLIYALRLRSFKRVLNRTIIFLKQSRVKKEFLKDVQFFFLKIFYKPFIFVFFAFNVHGLSKGITISLEALNIQLPTLFYLDPYLGPAFKLFFAILAYDFAQYVSHYLQHRSVVLWFFHKVHHRATVLNPLTKLRIHPVEYFFSYSLRALIGAPILFLFSSIYSIPNDKPLYAYLLTAMVISKALTHLRHSHIKIHYGILSYVFVSPVMHQVHHSILEKHHNKNIGVLFSLWDLMFGTFYLPQKNEVFKFGVKDYRNTIPSALEEFVLPFKDIYEFYRPQKPRVKALELAKKTRQIKA